MGRRSERLTKQSILASEAAGENDVIQVVSRAFDIMRCFEGHDIRLGNLEISSRCGLPRSTVSRLTHTLTRMGQLTYLPADQKYRIGPSAVAMSTAMTRGLQMRNLIRMRLEEVAEEIPGTIGFLVPDRRHLVYLEYARSEDAVGLHSVTGSRVEIARTAAGHAYVAALDPEIGDSLIADITRDNAADGERLRSTIEANRQSLAERGYVTASGVWTPHICGISAPIWSPQYQTYVVVTIGLLSAMCTEEQLHEEIGPKLIALSKSIEHLVQRVEEGLQSAPAAAKTKSTMRTQPYNSGGMNDLEAGARGTFATHSLRAGDGRF